MTLCQHDSYNRGQFTIHFFSLNEKLLSGKAHFVGPLMNIILSAKIYWLLRLHTVWGLQRGAYGFCPVFWFLMFHFQMRANDFCKSWFMFWYGNTWRWLLKSKGLAWTLSFWSEAIWIWWQRLLISTFMDSFSAQALLCFCTSASIGE